MLGSEYFLTWQIHRLTAHVMGISIFQQGEVRLPVLLILFSLCAVDDAVDDDDDDEDGECAACQIAMISMILEYITLRLTQTQCMIH